MREGRYNSACFYTTSHRLSDIYYRSSECFFRLLNIDPHYEFSIKTQEIYHGTN